jgi:hypothetical protein
MRSNFLRLFALVFIAPGAVQACSCVALGGCGMNLNAGSVVFLGKVVSKIEVPQIETVDDVAGGFQGYAVHLTNVENFQGAGPPGQEIVVYTCRGGADCGYPFLVGSSYLVYASSFNNRLSTGICSGTSPEVMVGGTLKELRAIRDGGRVDDLFGTIGIAPEGAGFEDSVKTRPLSNVYVHATRDGGAVFSTVTDEQGAYAFASLPGDTYRIEQDLPPGLSTWQSNTGKPVTVKVEHADGAGAGCQVDVFARPDGEISGIVINAAGVGVPGFVTVEPVDRKQAEVAMKRGGLPGCDTDDGRFSLSQLAPGRYRLVFRPTIKGAVDFQHTFYWPSRTNISNSAAIELGFGEHIDNVRFEVSSMDGAH